MDAQTIRSVSEVNAHIKALLESDELLYAVFVRGEISNLKLHSSGHIYMTLKDETGVLRAVMFRSAAGKLVFKPENGMKIIAHGRIGVFTRDGSYQLYMDELIPDGIGALYVAFEQLKERLGQEGLFDPAHKKPIPRCPARIAVVTSPTGAAIRDILRTLVRRWPMARVRIYPARVQGEGAAKEICEGIAFINRYRLADVIITGRGGGSIEDLWAFNEEAVARAIYHSDIPVISAVGHEPDYTISDFAADLRAPTPTGAGELAVPDCAEMAASLLSTRQHLYALTRNRIDHAAARLAELAGKRVLISPLNYFADRRMTLSHTTQRLETAFSHNLELKRQKYMRFSGVLDALSPLKVLGRGYALASRDGGIIKDAEELHAGDKIDVRLARGGVKCTVEEKL